jgi:alpha-glucosidase
VPHHKERSPLVGSRESHRPWWRDAVVYQIYPRSFADSNGDGIGDLPGVRARLDYLSALGVDAIWLSPFYRSPMADFGYDVSDYLDVDPIFGTLEDFDALVRDAHACGIKVLIDWVPNHTSSRHPWFLEARSSRDSPKRDWYVWRDGSPDRPPNNWRAAFGGPAWTWDEATGQWYLHLFLPEQPDLNWSNPAVVEAMHETLRFWLARGVDGFRVDVVHLIGKDPRLPDQAHELEGHLRVHVHDDDLTHELIKGIRRVAEEFGDDRILVGEVSLRDTLRISTYYGEDDELHLAFNFLSVDLEWNAAQWRALVEIVGRDLGVGAWPTWVLSNHDNVRARTRFGGSDAVARAAAVLLLTLRGTPFLYQGEELGLSDAEIEPGAMDPGRRDGCRAPIPWLREWPHGWPREPWMPFPPNAGELSVEAQTDDPDSILSFHRELLALRRDSSALRSGTLELLEAPAEVLCYLRASDDGDIRVVAVNFSDQDVAVEELAGRPITLSSCRRQGSLSSGVLRANEAVVLGS